MVAVDTLLLCFGRVSLVKESIEISRPASFVVLGVYSWSDNSLCMSCFKGHKGRSNCLSER